jgi:PHP family Zn ribbon phosphoesterase
VKAFAADLHIHTALSACADDAMTPPAIIEAALIQGLDMIAICDHNSARNVAAVQAASHHAVAVLAGMEITTAEEAHILGVFPDATAARAASDEVHATLPVSTRTAEVFGRQLVLDAAGEIIENESRMLFMASRFALADAVAVIRRHSGLAIASHVDRPSNSLISQLGMFPTDVTFDAIEISAAGLANGKDAEFAALGLPIVTSADSHFLADIGTSRTLFMLEEASFDELVLAFRGREGRRVCAVEGTPGA